jgi:TonB family protein
MLLALTMAAIAAGPEAGSPPWPAGVPRPLGALSLDSNDYPAEALRNGEQGSVRVALDVDADGRVTACAVTQSSGSRSLDDGTCPLMMRRAAFKPALDRAGRPVPGIVPERVEWRIEPGGAGHGEAAPDTYRGPPLDPASIAAHFSRDDYPADALRRREHGTVWFRVDVGANGRVSACTIERSSGSASLDSATCHIVQRRARFAPARDSAGNALPASLSTHIKWRLPR